MSSVKPVLSVLIPTCQRPEFLRQALRSVQQNGFTEPLEIIVSDDAPDETARRQSEKVITEFSSICIQYLVHSPPRDKPGNWQYAAAAARGEFCFKLDDDDLVLPGFFTQAVAFLRAHPEAPSLYPAFFTQDMATGKRVEVRDKSFFPGQANLVSGAAYLRAVLVNEGGYPRNHKSTAFYRRAAAEKIGHYALACEDFAFGAALALHGSVGYLAEPYFVWRLHSGSYHQLHMLYTWQMSQRALDGLEKIVFSGSETVSQAEWLRLIAQCRAALPLYYILALLRNSQVQEARALREEMEKTWRKPLPHAGKINLLFFLHRLGGSRLILFCNDLYFHHQGLIKLTRWLFRS